MTEELKPLDDEELTLLNDAAENGIERLGPEPGQYVSVHPLHLASLIAEVRSAREMREKLARWHDESARVALEDGMGAHSVAFCEGWVQAHSESASKVRGLP